MGIRLKRLIEMRHALTMEPGVDIESALAAAAEQTTRWRSLSEWHEEANPVLRSDHEVRPQGGTRRLALVAAIHCGFDLDARFATCKTTSTLQGQVSQLGRRVDHPFKLVHANVGVVFAMCTDQFRFASGAAITIARVNASAASIECIFRVSG